MKTISVYRPAPLLYTGEVYRLDFSCAQTNGSGGAGLALHRHAVGDNFCT